MTELIAVIEIVAKIAYYSAGLAFILTLLWILK